MGQYNLMFEQEEFTELVRLYSELAKQRQVVYLTCNTARI